MKTALYDMAKRPATFDIVPFVATVGALAAGEPLHLVVLADRFRDKAEKDKALTLKQKRERVSSMIVPCCALLPGATVEQVTVGAEADEWRRRRDTLTPSTFISEAKRQWIGGRDVRRLRAAVPSPHPWAVVITIRQNPVVPAKNCDMSEWLGAASRLMADGHEVVLVPDTAKAKGKLPAGFNWCREAATDVAIRAALYQHAACSLSMGLGPMAIAMFMPATRYVVFVNHRSMADQKALFERVWGIRWGQQVPFAGAGQVIDYRPDTENAIVDAFHSIVGRQAA